MKASVIMATYNGGRFVAEQLESIFGQSVPASELVIADDGSSDDTLDVVARIASLSDVRIRLVINSGRLGYARNFQSASRLASGDVVFLCDQDDVWRADKIERVLRAFADDPGIVCVRHDMEVVDAGLGRICPSLCERHRLAFGSDFRMYKGCSLAFRNSWLQGVADFEGSSWAHDDWWFANALAEAGVLTLRDALVRHRLHSGNVSGAMPDCSFVGKAISLANRCLTNEGPRRQWALLGLLDEESAVELGAALVRRGAKTQWPFTGYLERKIRSGQRRNRVLEGRSGIVRAALIMGLLGTGAYRRTPGLGAVRRDLLGP